MRILALDYSSASTGFCWYDTEDGTLILDSIVPEEESKADRIQSITYKLLQLPTPDYMVVEEVKSMINADTLRTLLRGVGYTIGQLNVCYRDVEFVGPGQWRKSAWGKSPRKRDDAKQLAMDMLWDWCIPYSNDDEAEALGIMLYYIKHNYKEHYDYFMDARNYKFAIEDVYET